MERTIRNKTMAVFLVLAIILLLALPLLANAAGTILSAGDIIILAINGDADATNSYGRGFSFMPLVDLAAGTVINFTDYGWSDGMNAFISNTGIADAFIHYTAPAEGVTAGTVIRCDEYHHDGFTFDYTYSGTGTNPYLNTAGLSQSDELLVFQGERTAPTFLFAVTYVSTSITPGGWATGVGANGTDGSGSGSALPPELTDDVTALSFNQPATGNDNAAYSGPTTAATKADWLSRVDNYTSWTFNDAAPIPVPPTGPFSVITTTPPADSAIFDFEANTSPVADNTGNTASETVTQTVNSKTISIVSTGGRFVVGNESDLVGDFDVLDGNIVSYNSADGGQPDSTRVRVSLQGGYSFNLDSLDIADNYKFSHGSDNIMLLSSSGASYNVSSSIPYVDDYGGATIDVSSDSGFQNISYFDLYANGSSMRLSLDRIDLTNITAFVAVTDITNVPASATAGSGLSLTGLVSPANATNQTISWSVANAGTTGASISGNTLSTTAAGTVKVTATIVNGKTATTDYTKDFDITVNAAFVPVTDITDLPTTATVGEDLSLTGTLSPGGATNQTITWSVKDAGTTGAIINGSTLSTTAGGTVKVTATVVNGLTASTNYSKDFDITVSLPYVAVTDITDLPATATAGEDLTLTGTVSPGGATNQTITWSVKDAGTTGAVINGSTLSTTAAGTVKVTATVVNGATATTNYAKDFDITVNAAFVPVTDITDLPTTAMAGENLTLTGTVSPGSATNQTITWSVKDAGTTGAVINGSTLSTTVAGTVKVTATVVNGATATTNYAKDFDITVNAAFVPVTDITDVPATATAGEDLTLTGTVSPGSATNQTITWSVANAGTTGASISGNTLSTTAAGTVKVTATVVNGASATTNYTKDFDITVNAAFVPVTDITDVPATATAGEDLTLTGTVSPGDATNQTITWSVKDAGTTGAVIDVDTLSTTAAGTVTVTATVVNGLTASTNYTKDFDITVNAAFVPVTDITDVPATATAGENLTLTGTVSPESATNQTISWSVANAGTTGASISGNTLSTTAAGTVKVTATVVNGLTASTNYTKDFDITVNAAFVPVTDITDLPTTATAGENLTLTGTVTPESATNQTITWSVKDAGTTGASISGNTLSMTAAGTVKVTATVVNGKTATTDYTKDFDITVNAAMSNDTLEEEVGDTTVVAEGLFAPDAQLIVVPIAANEPEREELEEQMGSKQIIAAFEARIEPDNAFEPPLTLTFQVGEQYNGQTVYILHRLQGGNIEQFTPTVANGAVSIIVQELSPFLLAVDAPLVITTQPQDESAVEGQTVTFSVWATGEEPLTYQWQRGNNAKAPWEDISDATAPDYTIESVSLGNHGERYRVIVTDALQNSVTSDVVTLTVTKAPASPDTGDHDQPILYAALTILFAAALMLLLRKRRA